MDVVNLSLPSMAICFVLLLVPVVISLTLRLSLIKTVLIAAGRMTIQLALIGVFLKYIFKWNLFWVNILWLLVMIFAAVNSVLRNSELKMSKVIFPAFSSFLISTTVVIFYVNFFVIRIDNLFDAKYLVVLSGMLLGNTLRGNIIGINSFYSDIKKDEKNFFYLLSLGASKYESLKRYLRHSMISALKPSLASMATMGLVALPGMMTGTILGGAKPVTAIKYQIMIMLAIVACVSLSVLLTILTTIKTTFTHYGTLKDDIFKKK